MKKYKSIIDSIPELKGHIINSKNQMSDTIGNTTIKKKNSTLSKTYQKI
jgi:hypothetical protein